MPTKKEVYPSKSAMNKAEKMESKAERAAEKKAGVKDTIAKKKSK